MHHGKNRTGSTNCSSCERQLPRRSPKLGFPKCTRRTHRIACANTTSINAFDWAKARAGVLFKTRSGFRLEKESKAGGIDKLIVLSNRIEGPFLNLAREEGSARYGYGSVID